MMFEHSNEHNVQDLSDYDQMSIEVENDALGPNEVPMDTTEVPKDDFSKLYMELIERVVEIQSMWDENQLPVGVQDRMLRLLFGDFGGARPRKSMLSFDYIPIGPQLNLLTKSNTFCHEMLNIWRRKQQWLPKGSNNQQGRIIDFWNGSKFKEVKDFWDPMASYELPVVCSNVACNKVYTTFPTSKRHEALQRGWDDDKAVYDFTCSECLEDIQCKRKMQRGDPRNVALLLHWDGFQTSRTTQKSCGVVEVLLLNAGPNSSIDVLPVLFIPQSCKNSIKNSGDVFSTCLTPLVDELEKLFLHGEDVAYEYPVEKIFDSPEGHAKLCKIRAMVMMVTGDQPAQCKIGMFKNGGSNFCRRDKAQATLKPDGRYVYDENRYQARFPPSHRSFGEMKTALEDAKRCCTLAEKEEAWKKAGLSGKSILWRLNDLYGFDMDDASQKKEIDAAVRALTKVVPSSIRYGRWPHAPSAYSDSFKAEENQKFIQWCLPYIIRTVNGIFQEMQDLGYLLIDIAHSFYNYSRDNGWSVDDIRVMKLLLQSWRVRMEEYLGPNSSPLEHVAGNGELLDDVMRLGLHDRYWCYIFERLVKIYSSIKTNNIQDEASFVQFYLALCMHMAISQLRKATWKSVLPSIWMD
ncbi:hypothetical protein L7F22_060195 [Adiantum nelumboides]|nr:hypothetical protein [Adiantum nelumboides]